MNEHQSCHRGAGTVLGRWGNRRSLGERAKKVYPPAGHATDTRAGSEPERIGF